MEIKLIRETFTSKSTIGRLLIDKTFYGWTLEDVDRRLEEGGKKIYGATAIPLGRYQVIINCSARFGRDLPLLLGVPQFEGIRIHPGNTPADTNGCILPGLTKGVDCVGQSRLAFAELYDAILQALRKRDDVFITVTRHNNSVI